jgi:hypothetical protein
MKVHRLVVNACTEYFSGAEKEGRLLGKQRRLKTSKNNIEECHRFIPGTDLNG